jgi:cyclopropane-fatty-acyl-phospholipid synthase
MEGKLRIEGDIEAYLRMRHQFKHVRRSWRLIYATLRARWSVPKDRKEQIAYHYDLGNSFFEMILDNETMSYSAGRYVNHSESLAQAQEEKLVFITEWLKLPEHAHMLDLGSGWGGLAVFAAKKKHWNVTGFSLSKEQLQYCANLVKTNGLENRVFFEYRDMLGAPPEGQFDGVAVIESIEHVGKQRLPEFFRYVYKTVKPNGPVVLQLTGRHKPRPVDAWTLKYVFPGGYLPAKEELLAAATSAGFVVEEFRDDTPDYISTMTEWIRNLEAHKEEIERDFGEPFFRLWQLWMHGAKVAFEVESMSLFRVRLRRPQV